METQKWSIALQCPSGDNSVFSSVELPRISSLIQVSSHYCSINISPNYISVNHMNENSHNIDLHNTQVIKFEFEGSSVVRFIIANLLSMHKQGEQATEQQHCKAREEYIPEFSILPQDCTGNRHLWLSYQCHN